jgi:hypothetical protein
MTMSLIGLLLALSVVVIATSSMRRKGKMTAATQGILVGLVALVAVLVAVLAWTQS